MSKISLTASMRNNLLSLQNISGQLSLTQNRLATGKKVNSAIYNPSNFYNASSILTEGANKLTLADMNEENANMLALQTRQKLAINSLSLASQASQAVLKLF